MRPARAWLVTLALVAGCPEERGAPRYNLPPVGAPALKAATPRAADAGPVRIIEEQLPEEATRQFRSLEKMARSPRWSSFAKIIRTQVADVYRRAGADARPKRPHDIAVTQYFIRQLPEIYGVDFVSWCGADYVGTLSYVENHLLMARQKAKLETLVMHRPSCGSVGDRTVSFLDLIGDARYELIESYVEDTAVGDDFLEVRVFLQTPQGLRRVAEIRVSSPVKFFNVEYRKSGRAERDIVTTHIELEKALGTMRTKPCWVYRYFEIETVYRYDHNRFQFVSVGTTRKRLAPNVALDLTGGEVPEGSCEG